MKKFLCMILVAVTLVSILGVAPEEAFAEKAYVEKPVGYDTGTHDASIMCKKFKVVHINIDKFSANDAVKKIYKYGKKGFKTKVAYTIIFDANKHDGTKSFKTDAEENKYDREKKIEKEFKDTWKSKM